MTAPIVPTIYEAEPVELSGIDAILAELPPPLSIEKDVRGDEEVLEEGDEELSLTDELGMQEMDELAKRTLAALYTEAFPLIKDAPEEKDWVSWADELWQRHSAAIQARLHLVQRNRLFRRGLHWISAIGLGPWREPPKPRDAARVVHNMVGPALDQRMQIISEQRPGFRTRPQSLDPIRTKRAEAQQYALEYQYDQQKLAKITRELAYWAGTDGVSFCEMVWDPERGPWDDTYGDGTQQPVGDIRPIVRRIEQVRVSANATYTQAPWYWIIREVMDEAQAVREYGSVVMDKPDYELDPDTTRQQQFYIRNGYQLPEIAENQRDQKVVDRLTIYCQKSEYLPNGLKLIIIGRKVIAQGPLEFGCVPVFAFRDGSTDPAFFPEAIMERWIDSQMRVNAVLSKWVENVRVNAGAKLLGRPNSIVGETLVGGTMSLIEVKGMGDLNQSVRPLEPFSLAKDALELIAHDKKAFEDLSGWNDVSRGQFASDQSGRAILAIREQLERVFAPAVNAAADAMVEWAQISLKIMKWGYDQPRTISLYGSGRPDLAVSLTADDFDAVVDVWIDPETLMPMPRALKMFLLDNMYDRGLLSAKEYRDRQQFSWVRNLTYVDETHEARARRVCEAIRQSGNPMALPILWMDDEATHQDVLQKELILPDDLPEQVRSAAFERWMMLAQQAQMKMMGMMPGAAPPQMGGQPQPGNQQQQSSLPPTQQPFQGTNPGVAAADAGSMSGPDENRAGRAFDQMPH